MNPVCRTAVPVARGERDSATLIVVRATAAIPISTFTKKIRRQDRPEVSTPPISGPMTTPRAGHRSPHPNATPQSLPRKASASNAANMIAAS